MLIKNGMTLLFYGDSLTCRTAVLDSPVPARRYSLDYTASYVDILMKRLLVHYPELNFRFYNKGIGGNTVMNLLRRYDRDVRPMHPDIMILLIGQNDVWHYDSDLFEEGLRDLLMRCARDKIKVVQLSTTAHKDREKSKKLAENDIVIKHLCEEFFNDYIDVKTHMEKILRRNQDAEYPIELFTAGSHLSELGNIYLADAVYDYITSTD